MQRRYCGPVKVNTGWLFECEGCIVQHVLCGLGLLDNVCAAALAGESDGKRSKTGCNPGTRSSLRPGAGPVEDEGEGLFSDKAPYCDKTINVDSVSQ